MFSIVVAAVYIIYISWSQESDNERLISRKRSRILCVTKWPNVTLTITLQSANKFSSNRVPSLITSRDPMRK